MRAPLSWLEPRPKWLGTLAARRAERRGTAARGATEPGSDLLRWLTRDESKKQRAALSRIYRGDSGPPGYSLSPAARAACRERMAEAIPIARGPARKNRTGDVTHEALWLFDPARPEGLWLALEPMIPPLFWLPAGTSIASAQAAIAPYFPRALPARLELPAVARGFAGTETMLEADHEQLENHLTMTSTLDFLSWGSDYDDDPWPAELPAPLPRDALIAQLREFMAQRPSRVRSTSFRSFWSRSIVTLERHGDGWYVIEARYKPARHPRTIRAAFAATGVALPEDLPVDVAAALLGLGFAEAPALELALTDPAMVDSVPFHLLALGAVRHSDLRMMDLLRGYSRSESVACRRVVAILADWLRYDLLLHELCAAETDPKLKAELEKMTAFVDPEGLGAEVGVSPGDEDDGLDDEEHHLMDDEDDDDEDAEATS